MDWRTELKALTRLFPDGEELILSVEALSHQEMPEPYRSLLCHDQHMTVTMEQYHGCPVEVHVAFEELADPLYNREIVLSRSGSSEIVQFGLVRFDFSYVTAAVKSDILAKQLPLGRVLIQHNVLRHIDLKRVLRIAPGPALCQHLRLPAPIPVYGRMATIHCNGKPAVELLEVVGAVRPIG